MDVKTIRANIDMETSHHHTFYNRAWYRTPILRQLRQHPLVVTPLEKSVHQDLHAELPVLPRPRPDIAIGALCLLEDLTDQNVTDPVLSHLYLAEHLLGSRDRLAHRIGRHIILQTGYIQKGYHDITD